MDESTATVVLALEVVGALFTLVCVVSFAMTLMDRLKTIANNTTILVDMQRRNVPVIGGPVRTGSLVRGEAS